MKLTHTLTILLLMLLLMPTAQADMGEATAFYQEISPAFGADVQVPSTVAIRHVFGTLRTVPSLTTLARIDVRIFTPGGCTGGIFVMTTAAPSGNTAARDDAFSFSIKGGECYEFVNTADPSTGNTIVWYSYIDITYQTFEGRAHANTTRLEMNSTRTSQNDIQNSTRTSQNDIQNSTRTSQNDIQNVTRTNQNDIQNSTRTSQNDIQNNTLESQVHANATWCPLTGSGCFVPIQDPQGNFTGNFTGNFSGSFNNTFVNNSNLTGDFNNTNSTSGNYTASNFSGNFTGTFIGNLSAGSGGGSSTFGDAVVIETAFDEWIPLLIWLSILIFFLYYVAWAPAVGALIGLASSLREPNIMPLSASIMIFVVLFALHVITGRGILSPKWGTKNE